MLGLECAKVEVPKIENPGLEGAQDGEISMLEIKHPEGILKQTF